MVIEKIINYFRAKNDKSVDSFLKEKIMTLDIVMLVMGIVVFSFGIFRYMQEKYLQSGVDLVMTIIIIFSYIFLHKNNGSIKVVSRFLIFFASLTALSVIIFNPDIDTRFSWIGICIYLMFFLLDLKEGIIWSMSLMVILLILYFFSIIQVELSEFMIFFIATTLLAFLLSRYQSIKQDREEQYFIHQTELEKQMQELRRAVTVKSDFLANMSHEIRTPLNALMGFISILQKGEEDTNKKKYLNIVDSSAKSLLTIINDILDFSKIESGKLSLESIPMNPIVPFEDVHQLFHKQAKAKDIKLSLNLNSNFPKFVLGDKIRIKQIISNLLSNAIKFTPKGGEVSINLSYQNNILRCAIDDSGIGIEKSKLNTIFESFSQADNSTTRTYGGTGLGLTISKSLVELMGGTIAVKSELGKGSSFYFTIVLEEAVDTKHSINTDEKNERKDCKLQASGKILVVDDNKMNRVFLNVMLTSLGLQSDTVENGVEAVEQVLKEKYVLILMDENMPLMNGIEATKEIRKLNIEKYIPIIAVTANALEGDKEKFIDAGMDDYISKPIDKDQFVDVLNKWLK